MSIGLFSDVHGDLEALQRGLDLTHDCSQRIFLGDVAGGRHVQECIELLQAHQVHCVAGNHDRDSFDTDYLPPASRQLLASWPLHLRQGSLLATHSLIEPRGNSFRFVYVLLEPEARALFLHHPDPLIAIGHTHIAAVHQLGADRSYVLHSAPHRVALHSQSRHIVNVPQASRGVVIYSPESRSVEFRA